VLPETSLTLKEHQRLRLRIFHSDKFFESLAEVIYLRPGGAGVLFGNVEPHFETFFNRHEALTLGYWLRPYNAPVPVRVF